MKHKYDPPKVNFILLDTCDIITTSRPEYETPKVDDDAIGGGGYDPDSWT